jgi:hypothetical protein
MRHFVFRAPRFPADLPVQLTFENSTVTARCREISKDGLVLEAQKRPLENANCTIAMSHKGLAIELEARVARSDSKLDVLQFIYKSEEEQKGMAHFVSSLAEAAPRPGPRLIV